MDLPLLAAFCRDQGLPLNGWQIVRVSEFVEALYRQNEVVNLTRVPREQCEARHLIDSLLVAEFVPHGSSVLDLGSGPGFPAWPLALLRSDLQVTAMDATAKVLRFLELVALPNLELRNRRAEDVDRHEGYDVVTGRAVAPLAAQLEVSAAWAKVGGVVVPFRTPPEAKAIYALDASPLGLELETIETRPLPGTSVERAFPVYRKTKKTPRAYPRTWAQIKKSPFGA